MRAFYAHSPAPPFAIAAIGTKRTKNLPDGFAVKCPGKSSFALLCIISLIVISSCTPPDPKAAQETPPSKSYLGHLPDAQYVGKEACKSCHADNYATFVESEMGRSFKPALSGLSSAKFEGIKPVCDKHKDFCYLPFQEGEDIFLMEFRLNGRDTVHKRIEKIAYIVGSGQHTNSHIIAENGYLFQAPLTWYAQEGKWDLPPGFEDGHNTRFGRSIELECMTCHNAMPDFVKGSENRFHKVPDGIDCERCHGPGSKHVEEKRLGSQRHLIDGIDYSIVHPGKLPIERQFDICQRCHLQGTAVPVSGKTFMDFRPGQRLSEYINIFIPRGDDSLSNFIMASHPDRLRMSLCYLGTQKTERSTQPMTCITCHNPHLSIHKLGQDHYREVCQSCHPPSSPNFCTGKPALRLAKSDNCVSCHMPKSGSSDIPHVRITDHFIRKPEKLSKAEADKQRAFFRLVCRTQDSPPFEVTADGYLSHYEQFKAKAWLLDSAEHYLNLALKEKRESELLPTLVRLRFLQGDFNALIGIAGRYSPGSLDDAWTIYRIGEAFLATGDLQQGISWLERAVSLAPDHLRFKHKLASAFMKNKQTDRAKALFDELVAAYSKDPSVLNNRGFAAVQSNDLKMAESDFRRALALDPDSEMALANLASVCLNTGRAEEAKVFTRRLLKIAPDNAEYLRLKVVLGM